MLKQWAILIALTAGIAAGSSAIAGGEECASKQTRADQAAPSAEQSAARSQSTTQEKSKQAAATN